jgi:hypothetical protein
VKDAYSIFYRNPIMAGYLRSFSPFHPALDWAGRPD